MKEIADREDSTENDNARSVQQYSSLLEYIKQVKFELSNTVTVVIFRADRKSQVRQCLGFCSADS